MRGIKTIKFNMNNNKSPLKFFLIVFALSIPLWVIDTMIHVKTSLLNFSAIDILAAFIPIITASILIYQEEGRSGIIALFKRILDFSQITKKLWYLPIVFLPLFHSCPNDGQQSRYKMLNFN
jgi:uncharacterized protein